MARLDLKARAKSAKTISRRVDGDGRAHGEEPREPSGFPDADEGVEGVFGSRAEMDAWRRHCERQIFRSVPGRHEGREGLPPLGPRWKRVRGLLSLVRASHPRPRPSPGHKGDPGH